MWDLLRPTEFMNTACRKGPTGYSPYPKGLESLTIWRWYKGSRHLTTLSIGTAGVEFTTSCGSPMLNRSDLLRPRRFDSF